MATLSLNVTALLQALLDGSDLDSAFLEDVYQELRGLARGAMWVERSDHTLQPTALVNEAYLRLLQGGRLQLQNRAHFFALAARVMRLILVDHERAHRAEKRGGRLLRVSLDEHVQGMDREPDLIDLDNQLNLLARLDSRQSRILELRFFAGSKIEEIADVLGISQALVYRELKAARGWLYGRLNDR
ncbi:MAG: ECF-type sigma factor [Acidobacteriota bacterium]|nr:ECF-type sigma factor [Acidobacteriota bacterium]